jgi:hypothetical protein
VLCFAYQAVKLLVSLWKTCVVREYRFLFHWLIYSICIWSKCRHTEIHFVWLTELTTNTVDCVWNAMAHAQKPDFVFQRNGRVHLNRPRASVQSTTGRRAVHIRLQGLYCSCKPCALQLCDAYWLPTPFYCFPFTSPVRHRVPSHFNWTLLPYEGPQNTLIAGKAGWHSV